jgi:hypothetical protein
MYDRVELSYIKHVFIQIIASDMGGYFHNVSFKSSKTDKYSSFCNC